MKQSLMAGLLCLALAGCLASTPAPAQKPVSEMTPQERCTMLIQLTGNPYLQPLEKAAAYEKARNDGCMGSPQPQTVIVR